MKISCNILKKHIKDSEAIDFIKIWDVFSIRTAEVETVTPVGTNLKDVVVAEIIECTEHPTKEKYHVLKISTGDEVFDILCGAPNARLGLKSALVKVGGEVQGFKIEPKTIAGVLSQGMLCSGSELGISDDHDGIVELPADYQVGKSIKEYLPIEDIIVEIENKSLTNRPDLWGHYGIAREIAAITGHDLLPLDVFEEPIVGQPLDVKVYDYKLCPRYIALKMDNVTNNISPLPLQIELYYVGMRSISLLVDLTNYLMIELGQPMHAFDASGINQIEVGVGSDSTTFTTLDNIERKIDSGMLMIKSNHDYFAIAGVMGGRASGINNQTSSIILESANFDAFFVRSTATKLGLRTEASARYEKSLDPNLTILATKRFVKLLKDYNPGLIFGSTITDVYERVFESPKITLTKEKLNKYLKEDISSSTIINILESLSFKVTETIDAYDVVVPTFRATKDVTLDADIIEEISRMYGYENIKLEPLKADLLFVNNDNTYQDEYNLKYLLATKYNMNEVHGYLWYKTAMLNSLKIDKDNVSVLGRTEDNILRDDLGLSLLDAVGVNLKNHERFNLFELGTIIKDNQNMRRLSFVIVDDLKQTQMAVLKAKEIMINLFKTLKNVHVNFAITEPTNDYYKVMNALVKDKVVGSIKIPSSNIITKINKKKIIVIGEIDIELYHSLATTLIKYNEVSKYPVVLLDYSIIVGENIKYQKLDDILVKYQNQYLKEYKYLEKYDNRYTIRFVLSSNDKTLLQIDIDQFKEEFIKYLSDHNLKIVE